MAGLVTASATIQCELGHPVVVQIVDGLVEKDMHRDVVEVNTETGEETVTYCPKCSEAADLLLASGLKPAG
ncbi:hypothetical protein LGH83_14390 [Lichenihabitans sp. PAMC28606]|uniref:hypothetical protein n=1 Tax=Lichenihabitans sp. PAMC28606 TaxID=2880932 RepID=UPI001D0B6CDD|nr:hypothetical protein [Lichenihabitans sp. PAMC28606]UDL93742.1 hypothetical protein LGH83_14390 [Lichenihabitans sp. PAMC28606]